MLALQIIFTALVALWADSLYLHAWSVEHHSPEYAPAYARTVIGDPYLFSLAIAVSLWFVCAVGLSLRQKWAYYGCLSLHIPVFLYGGFVTFAGLLAPPAKKYDLFPPILATLIGAPFFIVSGGCLYWLVTKRTKLLSTPSPGA